MKRNRTHEAWVTEVGDKKAKAHENTGIMMMSKYKGAG